VHVRDRHGERRAATGRAQLLMNPGRGALLLVAGAYFGVYRLDTFWFK
jgi:hypothetical protein